MHAKYKKQALVIIGINLDSTQKNAKKIPALFKATYDYEGKTADNYKAQVMPASCLIDRKRNVFYIYYVFYIY